RGYALRGATADGVVVSVRELDNDPQGDEAFYREAITLELRDRRGYALLDEGELRASTGEKGHLLRFGHDEEGEAYVFWLGLFVTEDTVFVLEAGGKETVFAPREEEVLTAFRGIRIR
ncbi:MAG: serine/threonine protein kinase, partial [Polyangiaceae bacterium]|nr:serine/threonine protein kinase [Polyangiaceae bacterium]